MSAKQGSYVIFVIIFMLGVFSIQSQNSLPSNKEPDFFSEKRLIEYRRLNEVKKFADWKIGVDAIMIYQEETIKSQAAVIKAQDKNALSYERDIQAYKFGEIGFKKEIINLEEIFSIMENTYEDELDYQKGKKWTWASIGLAIGALIATVLLTL